MRLRKTSVICLVAGILILMLAGCSGDKGFKDLEISGLDYEDYVETDGSMKGVSDDGSLIVLIEDGELIIYDVKEEDELLSENIKDDDIEHALNVWQAGVFSSDNKYVLFTDAPGKIANVLKYSLPLDVYVFDIEEEEFIKVIDLDEEDSIFEDGHLAHNIVWTPENDLLYIDYSMGGTSIQKVSMDDDDPEELLSYDLEDGLISEILSIDADHILIYKSTLERDKDEEILIYNIKKDDEEEVFSTNDYARLGFLDMSSDRKEALLMGYTTENRMVEYDYFVIQMDKKLDNPKVVEVEVDLNMSSACLSPGGTYLILKAEDVGEEDFSYYSYNIKEDDLDQIVEYDMDDLDGRFQATPFVMNLVNPFSMKITEDGLLYVTHTSGDMHYYEIEE